MLLIIVTDPIAENYKTVVCPFIDVLDYETFQYRAQDEGARGAFDWEFFYKRLPITDEDKKHPARPFELVNKPQTLYIHRLIGPLGQPLSMSCHCILTYESFVHDAS